MQTHPQIGPDWSLARLKQEYPGVEMALFAHFGIGSRERSGFSAQESLEELLRRHLIFDYGRACERLNSLAAEDLRYSVDAHELSNLIEQGALVIDSRSEEEHGRAALAGSLLLSHAVVQRLIREPEGAVVTVCRDGSQAPAASRVLRSQGLQARHLEGGLETWSSRVDPEFPVQFPLQESPGLWYLLADGDTLRYRRPGPMAGWSPRLVSRDEIEESGEFTALLAALPELKMVISSATFFAIRGLPQDLLQVIKQLPRSLRDSELWQALGFSPDESEDRMKLERVLALEAPAILGNHKGTVEVHSYRNGVLSLQLGGKCAGCASAQITTQRELAASLYREIPNLDRICSVEAE